MDDDFITDRILWRASKHGLPAHETFRFSEAPTPLQSVVEQCSLALPVGNRVLIFGTSPLRWTLLGTRSAISVFDNGTQTCVYSETEEFSACQPLVTKHEMEFLQVTMRDSTLVKLWGPPGRQFFAMWNIVLGLARLHSSDAWSS